jgi:hypothetical protein
MNVGIQGTKTFNDYNVFLRAMRVALSDFDQDGDDEFIVYSAGPAKINSFAMEFINIVENSLKARGIRTRVVKVPPNILKQKMHEMGYFAFFSQPKEGVSDLVREAEDKEVEVGIFRY